MFWQAVPNQFSFIAKTPVNPLLIPNYIIDGFSSSAKLIFMVIMSGDAFNVLVKTGALQVLIAKVVAKFGNKEAIFIPLLLLVFAARLEICVYINTVGNLPVSVHYAFFKAGNL